MVIASCKPGGPCHDRVMAAPARTKRTGISTTIASVLAMCMLISRELPGAASASTVRDKLWMFGVPQGADNVYVKRWSNRTQWSSISPVEATLYMGMERMMYVYQNSGFSTSLLPGKRQNGDGYTTCPLDPLNMLNASASCKGAAMVDPEHVWAADSLATMPAAASELKKCEPLCSTFCRPPPPLFIEAPVIGGCRRRFYRPMSTLEAVVISQASNNWGRRGEQTAVTVPSLQSIVLQLPRPWPSAA